MQTALKIQYFSSEHVDNCYTFLWIKKKFKNSDINLNAIIFSISHRTDIFNFTVLQQLNVQFYGESDRMIHLILDSIFVIPNNNKYLQLG